jgi:hypothetical protein
VAQLGKPALTRDVTLASRAKRRHSPAAQAFLALTLRVFDTTRRPAMIET